MVTISNQLANIIRPSVDCRLWWYRLWGGNINMYIPGKQVHDCGKFIYFIKVSLKKILSFWFLGSCKNHGCFAVFDSSSINSFNITKQSSHPNIGCLPGKLWTTFWKIKWISSLYSGRIMAKNLMSDICDYSLSIFLKCFGSHFPLQMFQHRQKSDRKIAENDWGQSIWCQKKVCNILHSII